MAGVFLLQALLCTSSLMGLAHGALNFESVQLKEKDVAGFPGVAFPKKGKAQPSNAKCKAFPGSNDWPSSAEWRRLNATLGGALLNPDPPAAACYKGPNYDAAKCSFLVNNASNTHYYIDDPISALTTWPQGSTCLPALNPTGKCTRGGYPSYIVNATTVKHIQLAINFARNKNVRLVIKNTGHDFGGRSIGAGSLSIWTHNLDAFEYLPKFKLGAYSGPAAHFGAGLEQWELFNQMQLNNITIVGAGFRAIGANGGWFASGGHGSLASLYGLAADQALELHVVTADGRYLVANELQNTDLFYALRGGGGSTYGVVTSVIVKAYPPITLMESNLYIACNPPADTNARARWAPITAATNYVNDTERFWEAVSIYFRFKETIVDTKNVDWDYIYPLGPNSFSFRTRISYPGLTPSQAANLLQPLYDQFTIAGFTFHPTNLTELSSTYLPYAGTSLTAPPGPAVGTANTRYRSRLYPRENWSDDTLFNATMSAIRFAVETGGYTFHGLSYGPTLEVAGYPGRTSAVNPAWRKAVMHGALMTVQPTNFTPQQARDEEATMAVYTKRIRDVTPGSGSYMNEGDPGEPDWQGSFYGRDGTYEKLLKVKKDRDPWGLFWARTTVGSEAWEVQSVDGYPWSQNGRLCKVAPEGKGKDKGKGKRKNK
ncbi:putative fad binding domain containing protein [Naviculisporaceae sp. PSN 640]